MSSPLQNNITNLQNLLDKVNALPEEVTLPELTNEGVADDLVSGKELIDSSGNVITGTNPYEKAATDTEIATQTELLSQVVAALEGEVSGGSSIKTCTVQAGPMACPFAVTKYEDGTFTTGWLAINNNTSLYSGDIENVVCGSTLAVYTFGSYNITVDGAEKMTTLNEKFDIFKITETAGAIVTINSSYNG